MTDFNVVQLYPNDIKNPVSLMKNHCKVPDVRYALTKTEWFISKDISDNEFWLQVGHLPNTVLQKLCKLTGAA